MSIFSWFSAKIYDKMIQDAETKCLHEWRSTLLSQASGRVLEIGAGTGNNLDYYPNNITKLALLEPNPYMCKQLKSKLSVAPYPIELLEGHAESIPFPDANFDTIVCTLVLCSVKSIETTLSEMHRTLVPGGKLIFIEHVAANHETPRYQWQKRLEPIWKIIASGCHVTRTTEKELLQAGFGIEDITRQSMRGVPAIARPSIRGIAIKQ